MIKSGKTDITDVCTTGNLSSFSTLICDSKTADFRLTVPTLRDVLNAEVNLPPRDNSEGPKQMIKIDSGD